MHDIRNVSKGKTLSIERGVMQISWTEKYVSSAEKELIPSDPITQPIYILNLIALIIIIIFCLVLFRIT